MLCWEPPGIEPASPVGTAELGPDIPRVIFNPVSLQEPDEFLLEGHRPVVLRLSFDVPPRSVDLRHADAEGAIALLPGKTSHPRHRLVDPFRRPSLDKLDSLGDW